MAEMLAAAATWLVTYLLHSTCLYGGAWLIDALKVVRAPVAREHLWRAALIGALLTATVQSAGLVSRRPLPAPATAATPAAMTVPGETRPALAATPSVPGAVHDTFVSTPVRHDPFAGLRNALDSHGTTWLALIWLTGAAIGVARLFALGWLARREIAGRREADPGLAAEFAALCAAHGTPPPRLTVAPVLSGPISLPGGEVVVPPWILATLDARQRRAMLAHELAHLRRRDPQWQLVALGLGALLWLQPLHGLVRRRLAHLAELEADGWAARAVGDPRALAECLAECATYFDVDRGALFGVAMATESTLFSRVDRLLKGIPMHIEKPTWPLRAGVVLALFAAAAMLPGCNIKDLRHHHGASTGITTSDGGDFRVTVDRRGYSLRVTAEGQITFTDDESDVASLEPGGEFELTEEFDGESRGYEVTSDRAGTLTRVFTRENQVVPPDAAAEQWLAAALPRMFRESGFDAKARVGRLLARGGPALVLAEVDLADTDHAKSLYLGTLLGAVDLDSIQLAHTYASAAKIESDFELAELLIKAAPGPASGAGARAAWLEAATRLGSDFELRRTIEAGLAQNGGNPAYVADLVALASTQLDSDFDLRTVLEKVVAHDTTPALARVYLDATARLDSDFERRSALIALIETATLDAANLQGALAATATLGSDFEKRTVLVALAGHVAGDPELNRRYRAVARDMNDFERGEALRALDDATAL